MVRSLPLAASGTPGSVSHAGEGTMSPDLPAEETPKSVIESELGSAVETHSSEKGSAVPDELNRTDAPPIRGELPEASKAEAPSVIGDHVLIRSIGRGAYGEVWLG